MSERESDARPGLDAALHALQGDLRTAEFQVRQFTEELNRAKAGLGKAECEAAELRHAISILQGGDDNGR